MVQELIAEEARFWVSVCSALVFSVVALIALLNDFTWWQTILFGFGVTIFFVSISLAAVILLYMAKERHS